MEKLPSHIICFINEILNDIKKKLTIKDYLIDKDKLRVMPTSIIRYKDEQILTEIRNNPDSKEILNKLEKRDKYLNYVCSCWLFKNQCKQRMERIKRLIREIIEKVSVF